MVRARELAPQDILAYYGRPLDELIEEERALALEREMLE